MKYSVIAEEFGLWIVRESGATKAGADEEARCLTGNSHVVSGETAERLAGTPVRETPMGIYGFGPGPSPARYAIHPVR